MKIQLFLIFCRKDPGKGIDFLNKCKNEQAKKENSTKIPGDQVNGDPGVAV